MAYDIDSYLGRADEPSHVPGIAFVTLLLAALFGVCVWGVL